MITFKDVKQQEFSIDPLFVSNVYETKMNEKKVVVIFMATGEAHVTLDPHRSIKQQIKDAKEGDLF